VANAHNLPMLFGKPGQNGDVKFTATGQPFNEMAFAKWISLQVSIMGAIYGIDPEQIHVEGFSNSGKSGLNGDNTEEKLAEANDTGFAPFMNSLASFMQDSLVAPFAPWVGVKFNGLIDEDMKTRQAEKRRMMTINESRKELGMDPHPLGWFGNLPADPALIKEEFQRLNATMTYDEARAAWGGLKVFPSELVGLAPLNPGLNAMYMQAAQAAGAEGGGEDEGGDGAPGGNPFDALNPGQGSGQDDGHVAGPDGEEGRDSQGEGEDTGTDKGEDKGPGLFDEGEGLKGDVAHKLRQV
jgi:hypothetical protein